MTGPEDPKKCALVASSFGRDPKAFRELDRAVQRQLRARWCALDIPDIKQEAYTRFLAQLERNPEVVRDPKAYICTVAMHLISERMAQRTRERISFGADAPGLQERLQEESGFWHPTTDLTGEAADWERSICNLPRTHREILLLRQIWGFTDAEVATALDISIHTIKIYIRETRSLLRREMQGSAPESTQPGKSKLPVRTEE
jgi:RNA polymerase sigma-70 factor (ECF subfamily)